MGFTLRDDLFFCIANGQGVLLDLKHDRYFALPSELDLTLQRLSSQERDSIDRDPSIDDLVDKRILVEVPAAGFIWSPAPVATPNHSIVDDCKTPVQPWLTIGAIFWQVHAALCLRHNGLYSAIRALRYRLERYGTNKPPSKSLLHSFLISRRVVPTQEQCLRWSLAMTRYLIEHGVRASLVIGVAAKPFRAHAWVQSGETVYSDRLDTVLRYTPILVV